MPSVAWTGEILLALVILDWDCLEIRQGETEPLHIRVAEIWARRAWDEKVGQQSSVVVVKRGFHWGKP
jgi:hypothetical protein